MDLYTGKEYMLIDIANAFGLDKLTFPKRIEWGLCNEDRFESMIDTADEKPLYQKAVMAFRKAQQGEAIGHMMGLDACSSGIQIMSAMTGCKTGALHTGLIDPTTRPDAYTTTTAVMNDSFTNGELVKVSRGEAKQALMTFFYGSSAKPKEIFGEGTAALHAFFEAAQKVAPGAYMVREALINMWNPNVDVNEIDMPDGFNAVLRIYDEQSKKIEVDELNHATFSHIYKTRSALDRGVSLAANAIHITDGMMVREMGRRCNYNSKRVIRVHNKLAAYCLNQVATDFTDFITLRSIDILDLFDLGQYDMNTLCRLRDLCATVLSWDTAPLVCIHDEFKASPNHMNKVRYWYKEILAEIADSNLLQDIIRQLTGDDTIEIQKLSDDLSTDIRNSNYCLA